MTCYFVAIFYENAIAEIFFEDSRVVFSMLELELDEKRNFKLVESFFRI